MTPAQVIQAATAEGVVLALSDTGSLKATGDQAAVGRWLPLIRQYKAAIVDELAAWNCSPIRLWLAQIGETDPATIAEVMGKCQEDEEARAYFIGRAAEPWGHLGREITKPGTEPGTVKRGVA
ncbi:hypothetical protein AZSI13_18610 [Azospira sp. I13]|uniref:hypothetical protein n=1 Tax=Azospira sp. I13 TaxID=1765050 RepID=UPI000D497BB5|nr:hypothetical protein [Azospira sp. I13]GBG02534.1 hypothetical protein AZSI13_18610 [Azospira sp. I13]